MIDPLGDGWHADDISDKKATPTIIYLIMSTIKNA